MTIIATALENVCFLTRQIDNAQVSLVLCYTVKIVSALHFFKQCFIAGFIYKTQLKNMGGCGTIFVLRY